MRFITTLLILLSLLPIQSGLGCQIESEGSDREVPCHLAAVAGQETTDSGEPSQPIPQKENHCPLCQMGVCSGYQFTREQVSFFEQPAQTDLMFEVSLRPLVHSFINNPQVISGFFVRKDKPIPSFASWQSYYSIFLI